MLTQKVIEISDDSDGITMIHPKIKKQMRNSSITDNKNQSSLI